MNFLPYASYLAEFILYKINHHISTKIFSFLVGFIFTPTDLHAKIEGYGEFPVKHPKLVGITVLLLFSLVYCQRAGYKLYSDVKLHPTSRLGSFASKKTLEGLLYEIWDSGFIRKNDLTKREILNNAYGIFRKAPRTLSDPEGRAFYQNREGKKDLLMLNAKLFGHLEPVPKQPHPKKVNVKKLDKSIRATLVHELFHDFWHNILDKRKRHLFTIEAESFFIQLMLAKTELQKQQLLGEIGLGKNEDMDFESFEVLLEIQDIYNLEKLGTELYATLAGRAYSGKTVIPKNFTKYYSFLLSDEFLDRDQPVFLPRSRKRNNIQSAKRAEDLKDLKIFLKKNPGLVNSRDTNGLTMLHYAAYAGDMGSVRLLMENGADLNAKVKGSGWTPFFLASLGGHTEMVTWFIGNGIPLEMKDGKGRSAVHITAQQDHKELVELLLRYGIGIHAQDKAGMTPLHSASLSGRQDTASLLIAKGADINSRDFAGQTPLHLAAFGGNTRLIELLTARGAEIDGRDNTGETALHMAAFGGHQDVVEMLVENGAKSDNKNIHGESPEKMAAKAGHPRIVKILRALSQDL